MPAYGRTTLQKLALAKLDDAVLLQSHGRHSNAYYLGGYAVELGLKAALTRQFARETLPDLKLVRDAYTHKLTDLVRLAGLQSEMRTSLDADATFAANWGIVAAWDETSRYESIDPFRAETFMAALVDDDNGIFQWLMARW